MQKHLDAYWEKYDHGFYWLLGQDTCPVCQKKTSKTDAIIYFENKAITLAALRSLAGRKVVDARLAELSGREN